MKLKSIQSVKKFYFLEYFYVLLQSVEKYSDKTQIFDSFKILKQKHQLGESKYKKLIADSETLSKPKLNRYLYTFEQVINESKEYNLIREDDSELYLTKEGEKLLAQFNNEGDMQFKQSLLKLMESSYNAFRHIITFLYEANKHKPGMVVIPNYSPRQLGFERSEIKTTADIIKYSKVLVDNLEKDIKEFLGENRNLAKENNELIDRLVESNLIPKSENANFPQEKYNVITKRFRDFWTTYFLQKIYDFEFSMSSFDIWTYRGKRIGIMQATEFYPGFNGRVVYPTSVIVKSMKSNDFHKLYDYDDGFSLYAHNPVWDSNQEKFVDALVKAYFDLRRSYSSYFINLPALKEIVCYRMKISDYVFQNYLENVYKLNLAGTLKIRISLEVDKLPEETKAIYLKREPVMVDGKYRNIIAIDVTKGAV